MDSIPKKISFEDLLRSPQFKRALFDVQNEECDRLFGPVNAGQNAPGVVDCHGECFEENGVCPLTLGNRQDAPLGGPVRSGSKTSPAGDVGDASAEGVVRST